MQLEELAYPLARVRGIGPASQKTLHAMGIRSIRDLLWHLPRDYQDRIRQIPLASALHQPLLGDLSPIEEGGGVWVNTIATVQGHEFFGAPPRQTLKIIIDDGSAQASLVCFGRNFLSRQLQVGQRIALCGRANYRFKEIQLSAFEFEAVGPDGATPPQFARLLAVYPLGGELTQGFFRKTIGAALQAYAKPIEEILPRFIIDRNNWPSRSQALYAIHAPADHASLALARQRLVYEELLLLQLQVAGRALGRRRQGRETASAGQDNKSATSPVWPALLQKLRDNLPFSLTQAQIAAVNDILGDLQKPWPMARLLQGDVGSGKTLVALLAALAVIANGGQVALMVPTVLLARQHAEKAAQLLEPLGIRVALLAGQLASAARRPMLEALAEGQIDLVIGTHALFGAQVAYKNLALAIIDEQHRFGVLQRQALHEKAHQPNLLMMSATPIPQTLVLTVFGDLEASVINELPAHRLPIETHLARMGNEQKVYDWVTREIAAGHQAYFVYPLIDENEGIDDEARELKNAETMFKHLSTTVFARQRLGMIHSKMEEEAKQSVMRQFSAGELDILVATSVVEVGVDVPNATCMVIEHAERFGLAALHQLRGRVGRGASQSYCFLVYQEPLLEVGKRRLKAIKESVDGFRISEEDLSIRGPGDLKGTAQSGFMRLHIADLSRDMAVMNQARADALALLEADPQLASPDNQGLRRVLDLLLQEELRLEAISD